jgi:hypothetical protein
MSINFTNIQNKVWRATGTNATTYTPANIAIDANIAQDEVWSEALKNNGWNVDDFNQVDYPIIYTNLNAGQRDYTFITDETGNRIIDIYKVMIMDNNGVYQTIYPVDQQAETPSSMVDGQAKTGTPTCYDLTSNGIFLDLIPSYTKSRGLKVFIDREPTYFTASDTTKVSGIDPLCHDYLYLKPAYEYARDKGLNQSDKLLRDLQVSIKKITKRYGIRNKGAVPRLVTMKQDNH